MKNLEELEKEFAKKFRELLKSLDDLNPGEKDLSEPIKRDIYFDGIETETFIKAFYRQYLTDLAKELVGERIDSSIAKTPYEYGNLMTIAPGYNQKRLEVVNILKEAGIYE